jgi:serine/threonine protein phosphatase PrpC
MEDEYFVGNGGRFAAVFDGHGGSGVSAYLKNTLYETVNDFLQQKHWEVDEIRNDSNSNDSSSPVNGGAIDSKDVVKTIQDDKEYLLENAAMPSVASHVAAVRAGFEKIERDVIEDDGLAYQGSTAVAIVLHESDDGSRTILSANVGDSRAILSRNGKAVDLTRDHKPNDEREKKRILDMGETIEWDAECMVHRVRNLSLARAIGDRYAKPAVSAEVEIKHFPVCEGDDEFVVLASDGLWDVMSSQDVVSFVHEYMDHEVSRMSKDNAENYKLVLRKNMAKLLAREAIRKGSTDNICVLMVWL